MVSHVAFGWQVSDLHTSWRVHSASLAFASYPDLHTQSLWTTEIQKKNQVGLGTLSHPALHCLLYFSFYLSTHLSALFNLSLSLPPLSLSISLSLSKINRSLDRYHYYLPYWDQYADSLCPQGSLPCWFGTGLSVCRLSRPRCSSLHIHTCIGPVLCAYILC